MNFQYPLETLARKRASTSQLDFAREARRVFDDDDDTLFEAHDHGLAILAAHENALERPVKVLRQLYGDEVEVRRPKVRYLPGEPLHEPIMHVRISVRREYADAVVRELRSRGARIVEQCVRPRLSIVRAEAPLALLLGLPALLEVMTDGTASHAIRLLHYAPLPPDPHPIAA
ncbi:MAG TPA: hypothetical protein VM073_11955 [Usitatibacter sp.]|nr:hypothetical protein [Usitatibacter sp.]